MIEFKKDRERDEYRLSSSGSVTELSKETCAIIKYVHDSLKQHNEKNSKAYLLRVISVIEQLCEED